MFGFPILYLRPNVNMKNIPPLVLPYFHWLVTKDPNLLLFEFNILCRSYNYFNDAHKLKLFYATLKYFALRWFMGLGEGSILNWEGMNNLKKKVP